MMMDLKQELLKLTKKWRLTGQKTRLAAVDIDNPLGRGHMHGVSDGLDIAADDVNTLLDKPNPQHNHSDTKQ